MSVFSDLFDFFFPPKCIFCGKFLKKDEKQICAKCEAELPYLTGGKQLREGNFFDVCASPLKYEGNVRRSILQYKFKGKTNYADCYGGILAKCIRENLSGKYDMISWVPLSVKRKRSRGYDQAMLLALAAALELNDVAVETLIKHTDVAAQSSLNDREKRKENISGVYWVSDEELIQGRKILLIDDIITTGSTLSECARTLLQAGAESVVCATLAGA